MLKTIVAPANLEAMQDLVRTAPPGPICEIGVFHGGSAEYLYKIALEQGRELHLFDTFQGTPFFTEGKDRHKIDGEFAAPEAVRAIRSALPTAHIHVGIYPDTHPRDLRDIAFIHCDCDQYLSYRAVIDRMWPLTVPGGILLFDDYPYLGGAKAAVEETFAVGELHKCAGRYYVVKAL